MRVKSDARKSIDHLNLRKRSVNFKLQETILNIIKHY